MDTARPERTFPHNESPLLSTNTANTILEICTAEHNGARESGIKFQNEKLCGSALPVALGDKQRPVFSVSDNFCINPIRNGTMNIDMGDSEDYFSMQQQMESQGNQNQTFPGAEGRRFLFPTESIDSTSSVRTESTALEEDTHSSENVYFKESGPLFEVHNADSDNEPFQPDEEDEEGEFELPPGDVDMSNSVVNINNSDVQFGAKYNIALPSSVTKHPPDLNISAASNFHDKDPNSSQSQGVNINIINTPPVQSVPGVPPVQSVPGVPVHPLVNKTQSTPVKSLASPSQSSRDNPRLPHPLNIPLATQLPQTCTLNSATLTPSSSPGNFHIEGAHSVILGTQIVINPLLGRENPNPSSAKVDKILREAEERLVLTYKQLTKRSLLPWLKGHQIMTEIYTEPRIFSVDRQGKQTRQMVDIVRTLVQEDETRFILEGEPGMGKTLLACKLAIDWANKKSLQKFKFVFLIYLRDYKDNLEDHIKEELFSSYPVEKFQEVWEYCKNNEDQVLFILDGYDELEKTHETKIQKLIDGRDFQRSKVVVTSRPEVLTTIAQRIVVKGFSEAQIFEFIGKYFRLVSEDSFGRNMKRIIEKDYKYRKLAKRPLFCVLLCMLYGSDVVSKLPEKLSDLMFKIILCLIKWNNKKVGNVDENTEAFPPEYEELFRSFGKLSVQALKTDKTRFSEKEILEIKGTFDSSFLLQLGFLSNDSENDVLGPKKFWKPVHKIFLEYMAGLYIAHHITRGCRDCKDCREFSSIYHHEHVLQFVVGTLDKKAYLALNGISDQIVANMKRADLLMLLREAGPTRDNCRVVASLLDISSATVYTSEVDFEGWGSILSHKFKKLKTLEIVWRIKSNNPDQESSFTEATPDLYKSFFTALKSNTSITKIKIRATQDGEPFSEKKIELFFSNLEMVFCKENLREIEIKELKMHVSSHLGKAIKEATRHTDKKVLADLEILCLDMFMADRDLYVLCDRLKNCSPNLRELQLTGLVIGPDGFSKLVELLKGVKNLHKLHISMDKAYLHTNRGAFMSHDNNEYPPSAMSKVQKRMNRNAVHESTRAFNARKNSMESANHDFTIMMPDKGHRNSVIPVVNTCEYYTDEELENAADIDNEVNSTREQSSGSAASTQLLSPREENRAGPSGLRTPSPKGRRSPSLPCVTEHPLSRSPSPMFDPANPNIDRLCGLSGTVLALHVNSPSEATLSLVNAWMDDHLDAMIPEPPTFFTCVKDPTKDLAYLFADPLHTGIKPTYNAYHYSFIAAGGEKLPLPLCNYREHKSVFHELFSVLPETSVKYLTLDYACLYLSTRDLVCLGDAIRKTKHLETLKLQNLKHAKMYIPLLLGLGQCQSLTTVQLESKDVTITDASFALACRALRNNTTLKSLSLAQWEFNLQDKCAATRSFRDLLRNWKVSDLNLSKCVIDIGTSEALSLFPPPLLLPIQGPTHNWLAIKTLKLPHVSLKEPLGVERRGHLLLEVLGHCPNLQILDLSAASNRITSLDDKATCTFFKLLGNGNFKKLKELILCNWEFKFKNYEETCSEIGDLVRSCTELKILVLDNVREIRSGLSTRIQCRATLLHQFVSNLPRLSELSLCWYRIDNFELDRDTAAHLGTCFHNHWNSNSKFKLKFFCLDHSVETALHDALRRDNFSVCVTQGYPLEISVKKRGLFTA